MLVQLGDNKVCFPYELELVFGWKNLRLGFCDALASADKPVA
jgi:hypothetical protein